MLETQIIQQTSSLSPLRVDFLVNLNLILGSNACHDFKGSKQLEGVKGVSDDVNLRDGNVVEKEMSSHSNDVHDDDVVKDTEEVPKDSKHTSSKPYTLPLPFPQRMAKAKLDLRFRNFLEVLKGLYVNIPFTDTLF